MKKGGFAPFFNIPRHFPMSRLKFASHYALRHLLISLCFALATAAFVFLVLYPSPFSALLGIVSIYAILMTADVVCGPLLTLILASPQKSRRERWMDFSLIGGLQIAALAFGLYSVWIARPVVLGFEIDHLAVVTANEIETEALPKAPPGMQSLPWIGMMKVSTRKPRNQQEFIDSVALEMSGVTASMRPDWWQPWSEAKESINQHARPVAELVARRPQDAAALQTAVDKSGLPLAQLRYLPLSSSKTKEWVIFLDQNLQIAGAAHVDGF
ncbi:fimb protein [Melaminivora sp.]